MAAAHAAIAALPETERHAGLRMVEEAMEQAMEEAVEAEDDHVTPSPSVIGPITYVIH